MYQQKINLPEQRLVHFINGPSGTGKLNVLANYIASICQTLVIHSKSSLFTIATYIVIIENPCQKAFFFYVY